MLQTITFDCWNTLISLVDPIATFKHRATKVEQVLQRQGQEVPIDQLLSEVKEIWEHTLKQQYEYGLDFSPHSQIQSLVERLRLKDDRETFDELYHAYTEALLEQPPRLMDGAAEVLKELKTSYQIGLICNTGATPGSVVRLIFERFGIDRYFNRLIFSNEVGVAKPNPEIFQLALKDLATEPEKALHIGDDPITDIAGAHQAGMSTIWFDQTNSTLTPPYNWRISTLREIPALLKGV